MNIGNVDLEKKILIVAEIGNNHEGSYTLAEELIGLAAETGVGAVKLQTFRTEHYVSSMDKARFNSLKSFELSYDDFAKLSKLAREMGLIFLSTPFDLESAVFVNTIAPAIKIASGDNNFYPLLETVARFGKPIIMSSGMADLNQIARSKDFIQGIWHNLNIDQEIAVLHCVSSYPVPSAEANLAAISNLKKELQCIVGYSDHTMGIEAAALSVALGARIVEKHFTLDKNYSDFRDHQLSADPREMSMLVEKIKEISILLGSGEKRIQDSETAVAEVARRSIVAGRDLPQGAIISFEDITWVRPSGGIPPGQEHLVVGRALANPVQMGEPIKLDDLLEKAQT